MDTRKFYVYMHRRLDNGRVFYIGKGTGNRAWDNDARRSQAWTKIVQHVDYYVEIYRSNLSETEALNLEFDLIKNPKHNWTLVNRKSNSSTKMIDLALFTNYFIDRESPSGLSRINSLGEKVTAGSISVRYGSDCPSCWLVNRLNGLKITAHRLILELSGIRLSKNDVVNHINCNPLDNRIENLEVCSQSQNSKRNRVTLGITKSPLNTSGITGVVEVTNVNRGHSYTYAMVTWSENRKTRCKKFSYNKYTKEGAWQMAIEYRKQILLTVYEVTA